MSRRFLRPKGPSAVGSSKGPGSVLMMPMPGSGVPFTSWTVETILRAIEEHEDGVFAESTRLSDALGRDERVRADLGTRANALVAKNGLEFSIVGAENNRPAAKGGTGKYVKDVEAWYWTALPEEVQRAAIRTAVMSGVSYGPIRWTTVDGKWTPRVEIWSNEYLWWDEAERAFKVSTQQGTLTVTPGTGEWFLYTPDGDQSWMGGAIRALGLLSFMRRLTYRGWNRFCERHGLPVIVITEPPNQPNDPEIKGFYQRMRSLGSTGVVRLPSSDWKFDFAELKSTGWKTFQEFLREASTAISITLLGQNLSTEVRGGSYAAAQAHLRVRQDYLDSDANSFSTAVRDCVTTPWGRFNVKSWRDEDAPWGQWSTGLPEDRKAKAETWKSAAEGLKGFRDQRVPVDVAGWCDQFGIPLEEGAPMPELPEEPEPIDPNQQGGAIEQDDAEDEDDTEAKPAKKPAKAKAHAHSTFQAAAAEADAGDEYTERLVTSLGDAMATDLEDHIHELLAIVRSAKSTDDYDAIRQRIVAYYRDKMNPGEVSDLTHAGMVLAQIAGRFMVRREAETEEP